MSDFVQQRSGAAALAAWAAARLPDYLMAIGMATLALVVRALLDAPLQDKHPFTLPTLAIIFVGWRAGFWPAMLALLVSLAGVIYFFVEPRGTFVIESLADQVGVGVFFFIGVSCALLGEAQRSARRRAAATMVDLLRQQDDLKAEVERRAEVEQRLRDREADLLRVNSELRDSQERFQSLAEAVPQIVWVSRPDGYLEYYNGRWYDYTGMSAEESIGFGWSKPVHPEDRDRAEKRWKQSTDSGEVYEIEYRFLRCDGVYRWFLGRGLPVRDESGRIVRWFGTCTDIDDKKRERELLERLVRERTAKLLEEIDERIKAEQKVEEMVVELRRSNAELEQFAYVASHDLQEPLRKIQAFGDRLLARFREDLGEQGRDYLDRMHKSAARMQQLINDLLGYSRVSTRPHVYEDVDLGRVAREVVSDLEGRILQTGGEVRLEPLPTIRADPIQMRQLLQNLIGNALKFHRPDVKPLVLVSGVLSDEAGRPVCRLEVSDNGIGFEERYRDRIFQVFQRLHGRGVYDGTGIGLAICRKIAERHGGSIGAQSQPGEGSTFTVTLSTTPPAEAGSDDTTQ